MVSRRWRGVGDLQNQLGFARTSVGSIPTRSRHRMSLVTLRSLVGRTRTIGVRRRSHFGDCNSRRRGLRAASRLRFARRVCPSKPGWIMVPTSSVLWPIVVAWLYSAWCIVWIGLGLFRAPDRRALLAGVVIPTVLAIWVQWVCRRGARWLARTQSEAKPRIWEHVAGLTLGAFAAVIGWLPVALFSDWYGLLFLGGPVFGLPGYFGGRWLAYEQGRAGSSTPTDTKG